MRFEKIRNSVFIIVFFGALVLVNGLMLFAPKNTEVDFEYRELASFPKITLESLYDGSFQTGFETAYADQFYGRGFLVKWQTRLDYFLTKYVSYFNQTQNKLIPVREVSKYNEHYIESPLYYSESLNDVVKQHAIMYNKVANFMDQPLFIYKNLLLSEVDWLEGQGYQEASKIYKETFTSTLDDDIYFGEMQINNYDEYYQYFYKTDLHHTADGAYVAYTDLIEMINEVFPQIGHPRSVTQKVCFEDVYYRGSYARRTGMYSRATDQICDLIIEGAPQATTYVDGLEKENGDRYAYHNGYGPGYKDIHHYDAIYGGYAGEIKYDYGENTGINALFLVDSFSNPMNGWFASHFDETYIIDLRLNHDFMLSDFLKEHDIDVVAVYLYYDRLYFSDQYLIDIQ